MVKMHTLSERRISFLTQRRHKEYKDDGSDSDANRTCTWIRKHTWVGDQTAGTIKNKYQQTYKNWVLTFRSPMCTTIWLSEERSLHIQTCLQKLYQSSKYRSHKKLRLLSCMLTMKDNGRTSDRWGTRILQIGGHPTILQKSLCNISKFVK